MELSSHACGDPSRSQSGGRQPTPVPTRVKLTWASTARKAPLELSSHACGDPSSPRLGGANLPPCPPESSLRGLAPLEKPPWSSAATPVEIRQVPEQGVPTYPRAHQSRAYVWPEPLQNPRGGLCKAICAKMDQAVTLRDSVPVVLVRSSCTCAAGQAVCNHLVALLYQTAHYSESGMSVVPPVLSCTETEQKWHKPRSMGVKPGPVDTMVVVKARPGTSSTSGIRSTLYKAYSGDLPVPSTLNPQAHYAGFDTHNLPLICHMNISDDKPLVDSVFGKVQAGSILSYHHPLPTPGGIR
ncbi:hypothetical protein ROHU_001181 [Labeo rohita]|uniref:SWIM-type domain-containing protein n=1 Tax=Labeo rohita TaxID=84645 RepID=A0A498P4L2_LABRO|nr:hypothetical protein ROHU_026946 [Labeo rohita]RXN38367.1 hypothetical protein ROHU_001181 [Labeo rohita]